MKDSWKTLKYPSMTEKNIRLVESENTLVFMVDEKANKSKVKSAVEDEFNVKVSGVRTLNNMKGEKKAFVKLSDKDSAGEIATKLGII